MIITGRIRIGGRKESLNITRLLSVDALGFSMVIRDREPERNIS